MIDFDYSSFQALIRPNPSAKFNMSKGFASTVDSFPRGEPKKTVPSGLTAKVRRGKLRRDSENAAWSAFAGLAVWSPAERRVPVSSAGLQISLAWRLLDAYT
jgi:hypothetical protein